MTEPRILLEPVFPTEKEAKALKLLDKSLEADVENSETPTAKLLEVGGKAIPIPESLYQLLRQATHLMAAGRAVSLMPLALDLTAEEAANLLNVSKQFLVKLLESGEIPYSRVGVRRQIRLEDLMLYKKQRDAKRREILREVSQFSQEEESQENSVYS